MYYKYLSPSSPPLTCPCDRRDDGLYDGGGHAAPELSCRDHEAADNTHINIHGNKIEPSDSRGFTQAVVLGCGQCVEGGDDGGDGDDVRHVLLCCDADCRD